MEIFSKSIEKGRTVLWHPYEENKDSVTCYLPIPTTGFTLQRDFQTLYSVTWYTRFAEMFVALRVPTGFTKHVHMQFYLFL